MQVAPNDIDDCSKYPRGVFVMFFMQLISMIGFSFVMYLLVLYCTSDLNFSDKHAYSLGSAYIALMYAWHVTGGYIGEKFFGYKKAIIFGIIVSIFGLFLIPISKSLLTIGLSAFIVGSGILIPCSFVLLSRIYSKNHPHREAGFIISYIGMNTGSFLACGSAGPLQSWLGYGTVFWIGGAAQILLLMYFIYFRNMFKEEYMGSESKAGGFGLVKNLKGALYTVVSVLIVTELLRYSEFCNAMLLLMGACSVIFVLYVASQERGQSRSNLHAFITLTVVALCFWSLYMLSASGLTLFIERNVDRHIFHFIVPTASFSSLNPFFIVILGPFVTSIWRLLTKRGNQQNSIAAKFSCGLIFMGLGFMILYAGIHTHNAQGFIPLYWIVISYLFQTIGELFVGPVGFSMVGSLVPARMEALMVGIWELASGVAGSISGYLSQMTSSGKGVKNPLLTDPIYAHHFIVFGLIVASVGVFIAFMAPRINKWAIT